MKVFVLVNLCLVVLGCHGAPSIQVDVGGPVVTLPQGTVEGVVRSTPSGKTFNAFMGIPYGTVKRFAASIAAGAWNGTLDATQEPEPCSQPKYTTPISSQGIEDCLTVSVFTPSLSEGPYKVHVFIHGGAFFMSNIHSTRFGPERILDTVDVVVVLIQYRLGALGFLSTGDASAPGNFGLRDQNLGLQWVQSNIQYFNGDPTAVTLSGESAGSVSVSSHLLSPYSAGLFNQTILQSGTALNSWGYTDTPLPVAQDLARRFNCDISTNQALVDCLKTVPADDIAVTQMDVMVDNLNNKSNLFAFVPVVDGDFIPDKPLTLYQTGQFHRVPMIQGFNRDEGAVPYMFFPDLFENIDDTFFTVYLPRLVQGLTDYTTNIVEIASAVQNEYYNIDLTDKQLVARTTLDLLSDMMMIYETVETIQLASQYVNVYMYELNYVGDFSYTNFSGGPDVTHGIDVLYIYNVTEVAPPLDARDSAFAQRLVDLWTNFDTLGNPTPTGSDVIWPTTPAGQTRYISLDNTFTVIDGYDVNRMNFWLVTVPQIAAA